MVAQGRARTAGTSLAGRAFLHDYDWTRDEQFKVLELILTAPVVVASWISLQYYGSTVAPAIFGAGNKLPLLHVDSTWELRSLIEFRDAFARRHGFELVAVANEEGRAAGINPFDHGDRYTTIMRTEKLKAALDRGGYDFILGGARRDEEKSRAKERVFSVRSASHGWDPRQQRPELWRLYNARLGAGQTAPSSSSMTWSGCACGSVRRSPRGRYASARSVAGR